LHDAVRDRIAFGIAPAFYAMKASEVLDAGVGYCNTKSTLFCALLRARGIAARIRMFDLSAAVLTGLFNPGSERVDHAVTEVWLRGRWLGVDSYVVDPPLERAARARLAREGKLAGYGIHRSGSTVWDGQSATRIQCVESAAPAGWIGQEHGVFDDVNDFYARVPSAHNRLNVLYALFIRFGASRINQGIDEIRRQGATG
jgi:transglutaminase-like putative cysteine protease